MKWMWLFITRHLRGRYARPAVKWMNRLALISLVIGVFAWTSVVSIMNGLQRDIRERVLSEKPHLIWEGSPREDLAPLEAKLRALAPQEIKKTEFILQSEGLLEVAHSQQRGRVSGSGVLIQGRDLGKGTDDNQMGIELASLLRLAPGDELRLRSAWRLEAPPLLLQAGPTFETGVYDVDRSTLRIDRKKMESWLGLRGAVSRVEIQLHDPLKAAEFRESFSKVLGLELKTWEESESALWYSLKLEKYVMFLAIFFIVLLAALAVHLALAVRVAEKTREIALLRALGAPEGALLRIYLFEGLFLGVVGSLTGLLLSFIFCRVVSGYFKLPEFYYSTSIPVDWSWSTNLSLISITLLLCGVASYFPARRVRELEICEALRS